MMADQCSFCRGTLLMGTTEFMVRMGSEIIVIKDVPAFVCDQCNESYFTPESSREIDRIIEEVKKGPICGTPLAAIEVSIQE